MRVTLLQMPIAHADFAANAATAEQLMASAPGADLYVLPEMWSTGFAAVPSGVAEAPNGPSVQWMISTARRSGAAICGSVAVEEGGKFFNRFVFAQPDGSVSYADKRHLFSMGGEAEAYAAGQERVVVTVGGVRCLLLVCYDLRFPVWSRCQGAEDYDAIIYVANWPRNRADAWDVLLRARAIENQAWVIGVNRVGTEGNLAYNGHSVVLDPRGRVCASLPDDAEGTATADISAQVAADFRRKFPVLADADHFQIPTSN